MGGRGDKDQGPFPCAPGPGWCLSLAEPTGKPEGQAPAQVGRRGQSLGHTAGWGYGGRASGAADGGRAQDRPAWPWASGSSNLFCSWGSLGSLMSSGCWTERLPESQAPTMLDARAPGITLGAASGVCPGPR